MDAATVRKGVMGFTGTAIRNDFESPWPNGGATSFRVCSFSATAFMQANVDSIIVSPTIQRCAWIVDSRPLMNKVLATGSLMVADKQDVLPACSATSSVRPSGAQKQKDNLLRGCLVGTVFSPNSSRFDHKPGAAVSESRRSIDIPFPL
ncbi:MAG: hypothetical protein Q9201_001892 [Fulgogasparrea decipioides]